MSPRLSLVMIVRDEADCLADCLQSARHIVDEIVIADTGSTDGTPEIARQFGAIVFDQPWRNDFADARNAALGRASGDWALHLDADEVLDPEGAALIRQAVDVDGNGADAFEVTLANYCDDPRAWRWTPAPPDSPWARGRSGYLPVPLVRLFRTRRGFEYREPIHENLAASIRERGGVIRPLPVMIHHYGYDPEATRRGKKASLYLAIARDKAAAHPDDPKARHDYAEQALACGDPVTAEAECRAALAVSPAYLPARFTLATILLNRGALREAETLLRAIASETENLPHAPLALGAIALRYGDLTEAERWIDRALALQPRFVLARLYRARLLDLRGETAAARQELETAVRKFPSLEEPARRLRALTLRHQATDPRESSPLEALRLLLEAQQLDPEDPIIYKAMATHLEAIGQHERAAQLIEKARALAPFLYD